LSNAALGIKDRNEQHVLGNESMLQRPINMGLSYGNKIKRITEKNHLLVIFPN
jgi:hypothetical protein